MPRLLEIILIEVHRVRSILLLLLARLLLLVFGYALLVGGIGNLVLGTLERLG